VSAARSKSSKLWVPFMILALGLGAPVVAASSMPTAVSQNVSSAGGVLGTADGAFAMTIPPNVLVPGENNNLGIGEATSAPPGAPPLPAEEQAISAYFELSGATMSAPQTATIQYDAAWLGTTPTASVTVYAWQGGTTWQFQPTVVDASNGSVQVYIQGPETVAVLVNRSTFSDVPTTYWAASSVDTMAATGVMNGLSAGTFGPDQPVTRGQFAKMLTVGLDLPPASGPTAFTDVPANAWYSNYVAAVADAGLMTGDTATTFDPNAPVTREQLAVLLMRALKLQPKGGLGFTDSAQVDPWAVTGVEAAVGSGYMMGYPDGSFQPQATMTRAQAATVLARVIASRAP
jgi:hypothetical protein